MMLCRCAQTSSHATRSEYQLLLLLSVNLCYISRLLLEASLRHTHTHKPTHMENVIRSASYCGFRVTQSLSWSRRNKRVEESGGMDEDTGFLDRFWVEISEQLVSYKQYIMSFISPTLLAHGFLIKNNLSWFSVKLSNPSHCLSHHIQNNLSIVISLTLNTYREEGLFVFTELITCFII